MKMMMKTKIRCQKFQIKSKKKIMSKTNNKIKKKMKANNKIN